MVGREINASLPLGLTLARRSTRLADVCGRYSNHQELNDIRLSFSVDEWELSRPWQPTYNFVPNTRAGTEPLIVVRTTSGQRAVRLARWGLIPAFWDKPLNQLPTSFNARSEDALKRPFFRESLVSKRCLVPATAWREFTGEPGHRQPHVFHLNFQPCAFAGLWSTWRSPEGISVDSFAILTTRPTPLAAAIHDRMPLVVSQNEYGRWMDTTTDASLCLADLCRQAQDIVLSTYPSDPVGNQSRYEGPGVLAPAPIQPRRPVQQELFGLDSLKAKEKDS